MHDTSIIDAVEPVTLAVHFQMFLATVADHKFHRTQVKNSLVALFRELAIEVDGIAHAKNFLLVHPYRKEQYWEEVFRYMAIVYGYLHKEIRLINCAIIARIQHDVMVEDF